MLTYTLVLLVDEATSGVDPLSRRALWRALTAVKHERTVLFTTHVSFGSFACIIIAE
jgi:ABC-type multidrug transport system ATPase subunit